eukprot:GHVQ01009050.1.p1 GENE.GHVQ01009050.1~~GHVQ01009050.1.p1  ORF type:complete len:126 (-),score=21.42 GHVQ01009050.1:122-499(-)
MHTHTHIRPNTRHTPPPPYTPLLDTHHQYDTHIPILLNFLHIDKTPAVTQRGTLLCKHIYASLHQHIHIYVCVYMCKHIHVYVCTQDEIKTTTCHQRHHSAKNSTPTQIEPASLHHTHIYIHIYI